MPEKKSTAPVTIVETTQSRPNTSIGELLGELSNQITTLVRGEIELTKTKATTLVKKAGVGVGLLAGAGVFALYLLGWLFHSAEMGLRHAVPDWAAALIVAGILLLIVVILAIIGLICLKKGMADKPDPAMNMKLNVEAVKKGIGK